MPILDARFENGIFYARQVGPIEAPDARQWVDAFKAAAAKSLTPIVALIDAREVKYVSPAASLVFIEGSNTPNVKAAAVVANSMTMNVRARTIGMMSERQSTHETFIFGSLTEAEAFAKRCAREV